MPAYFPPSLRRRLAPLVLVVGVFLFSKLAYEEVPREQEVHFLLGGARETTRTLRVTYTSGNEVVSGMEQRFPSGAPAELVHTPSLAPGQYDMAIELTDGDGNTTQLTREMKVPVQGALRIRLSDTK